MKNTFILGLALMALSLSAQTPQYPNGVYDDQIHAVKFSPSNAPLVQPVAALKAPLNTLRLTFDRLGDEVHDYVYSIVHCNAEWQPTDMEQIEYVSGFTEDRIRDFQNSRLTLRPYITYTVGLPNANMKWNISGNYLLLVYDTDWEDTGEKRLVIVKRFMVVENTWPVSVELTPAVAGERYNTHQEFDFFVGHKGTRIANPQLEVRAFVQQNTRWDNAIGPLPPYSTRTDLLVFDYFNRVQFAAGKEWRTADLRGFNFAGFGVRSISPNPTGFDVVLDPAKPRVNQPYLFMSDLNGAFSIENAVPNQTIEQCEYANVLFSLLLPAERPDQDIYLFGELTQWGIWPQYKMAYDDEAKAYYLEILLKQGIYDYGFAAVNRDTGTREDETIDGDWFDTDNVYSILVYYKPFGARYERLMAVYGFDVR